MTNTPADAIEVVAKVLFVMDFGEPDVWDKCEPALVEYRKDATAALTAYHKHLADKGMVIVPRDDVVEWAEQFIDAGKREMASTLRAMIAAQEQGQ